MKQRLKALSFQTFLALDRLGVHVLPKHYYTPLPDYKWLQQNPNAWMGRTDLTNISWDLGQQVSWIDDVCSPYYSEVEGLHVFEASKKYGPGYGAIESQVLHCVIRTLAPPRIVEIGSGASTAHMIHASSLNAQEGRHESKVTCIEPFPKPAFENIKQIDHIRELCQVVPGSIFSTLKSGDILFIDSTHALKLGSDVIRIYLDIIPKLCSGVYIHIHDVYLPYVYPRDALSNYFGWQETALLLALLSGNPSFKVLACLSALHYDRSGALGEVLRDYKPQENRHGLATGKQGDRHFPSSLWMRTL